jgi:hypothetical protein
MHAHPPISERFRESMRYRRRLLSNRRTHLFERAAAQIRENGRPKSSTQRRIRYIERQIREFNSLAEEAGLQAIRT